MKGVLHIRFVKKAIGRGGRPWLPGEEADMHRVHAEAFIRRGEAEEVLEVATEVVLSNATSEEEPEVLPILHFGLFDMTVSEAKAVLATASRSEAEGMRVEEAAGKARSTLLAAIDERLEE